MKTLSYEESIRPTKGQCKVGAARGYVTNEDNLIPGVVYKVCSSVDSLQKLIGFGWMEPTFTEREVINMQS